MFARERQHDRLKPSHELLEKDLRVASGRFVAMTTSESTEVSTGYNRTRCDGKNAYFYSTSFSKTRPTTFMGRAEKRRGCSPFRLA